MATPTCEPEELLFARAVESVEPLARDRSMVIQVFGAEETIHADEDKMVQVLVNLISNAIKFSYSGDTISVFSDSENDRARSLEIARRNRCDNTTS